MKKLFLLTFLFSIKTFAAGPELLGGDYYSQLLARYAAPQSIPMTDFSNYNKMLFVGRCFYTNDSPPVGAALSIENKSYDNGPIGIPGDYITYGSFNINTQGDETYFDNMNFNQFKLALGEDYYPSVIRNSEVYVHGGYTFSFRHSYVDDFIYGIVTDGHNEQALACYFFKKN